MKRWFLAAFKEDNDEMEANRQPRKVAVAAAVLAWKCFMFQPRCLPSLSLGIHVAVAVDVAGAGAGA